jgi:hypothetical protein
MIFEKIFGKSKIMFKVEGKPPQKSEWGGKNAQLVIDLRKAALKARTDAGLSDCIKTPVKLKLEVHALNPDKMDYKQKGDDDEEKYSGDLDSMIAGVCDYLSRSKEEPGRNNFVPSSLFDNEPEIYPNIKILIEDDSLIKIINAEKIISKKPYYVVTIELI